MRAPETNKTHVSHDQQGLAVLSLEATPERTRQGVLQALSWESGEGGKTHHPRPEKLPIKIGEWEHYQKDHIFH